MDAQALTVRPAVWSDAAADMLAGCFTVPGALAHVASQVRAGIASLFEAVAESGEVVCRFVLRTEYAEGVIVAASGPADLVTALLPNMERRFTGCRSVRIHTARPAVARILAAAGYSGQEIVLRRDL